MTTKAAELSERLQKPFRGRMSEEQLEFLRDVQAAIDFGIRNGMTFSTLIANLGFDFNEISRALFDLELAKKRGFEPKVAGFSKLTEDYLDGIEEPLE